MEANQETQEQQKKSVWIYLLIGMLLINALLIYLILENKQEAINNLNRILIENKGDYEKKLSKLEDRLRQQIEETKQIQGNHQLLVDSIQQELDEVIASRNALRNNTNISQTQLQEYKEKIEIYELLMKKKDAKIEELNRNVTALGHVNQNLQEQKVELTKNLTSSKQENNNLSAKFNRAAVLKAENLIVNALEDNNKIKTGGQYRAVKIDKLDINFKLGENKFAQPGTKDVFLRVLDPNSAVLYNQDGTSGNFTDAEGKNIYFSARQQILFNNNSNQNINFKFGRTGQYTPGRYAVEIFCDGEKIGQGNFEVR